MTASLFDLPEFEGEEFVAPVTEGVAAVVQPQRPSVVPSEPAVPVESGAVPEREVTFLHTADWQIGMTRRYLDADGAHAYAAARQDALVRIGEIAREVGAEFVIACGDVFEDHRVSAKTIRRTLDRVAEFGLPVYLLPGNHDPMDAASVYRSKVFRDACPENVTVLADAGVVTVRDGIELIVAPWTHKHPTGDLVDAQVRKLPPGDTLRIVVGHGGIDTFTPSDDPALVKVDPLESALSDELIDYVALGDRHSVTEVGESGRIWYSGAHEVTNFDHIEDRPGYVLAVTLRRGAERTIHVEPHRVGRWAFRGITREVNGDDDIAALRDELESIDDKPQVVIRLGLVGTVTVTQHAELEELLDGLADRFAALVRWDRNDDLVVVGESSDIEGLGLGSYASAAAEELLARSHSDTQDAETARDALGLLQRLAGGQRGGV